MAATDLFIFAKHPSPGEVMTRLCPPLTPEEAADVQRACIRLLCERAFRSWPVRPILVISPDDAEEGFREFVGPFVPIIPQGDGNLGDRLARMTEAAFNEGAERILIVGADSPTISERHITNAQEKLNNADVALGPCDDGGFYLIGLNRWQEGLFNEIDWSTEKACKQVQDRAKKAKLSIELLDTLYDIDVYDDLLRAAKEVKEANQEDALELMKTMDNIINAANRRSSEGTRGRKSKKR